MDSSVEHSETKKEAQKLQAENGILQGRILNLTQQIELKNHQIDELFSKWESSDLKFTHKKNQELIRKLELQQEQIKRLESEQEKLVHYHRSVLEQKGSHFESALRNVEQQHIREREKWQSEMSRLENLYQEKLDQVQELNRQLLNSRLEFRKQREKLQEENVRLESFSRDKEEQIQALTHESSLLKRELVEDGKNFKNEVEKLKSLIHQKESFIQELTQELKAVKEKMISASSSLENSQKEFLEMKAGWEENEKRLKDDREKFEGLLREKESIIGSKDRLLNDLKEKFLHAESLWRKEQAVLTARIEESKSQTQVRPQTVEPAAAETPKAGAAEQIKILLAESHPESVHILNQTLVQKGYQLYSSMDGGEVIELARKEVPDLIVMNVAIGGTDSYTVCRILMEGAETKRIPIILIASSPETTAIFQENLRNNVKSYLYKPFSISEFLSAVQNALSVSSSV